jgi:hypothetical protein
MHDGVEAMRFERCFDRSRITKITDNELASSDELTMPAGQVVEDNGAKSTISKLLAHVRADIAGAAAD